MFNTFDSYRRRFNIISFRSYVKLQNKVYLDDLIITRQGNVVGKVIGDDLRIEEMGKETEIEKQREKEQECET